MSVERLPDDLAELARQLADDAARLAEDYPARWCAARAAGAPAPRPRRRPRRNAPGLALTAAAVLVLAAGIGLLAIGYRAEQPARMSRSATAFRPATASRPATAIRPAMVAAPANAIGPSLADEGAALAAPGERQGWVGPQLTLRARAGRQIEVRHGERVEELAAGGAPASEQAPAAARLARDELSMLRTQLTAFEKVIQRLQLELARRDELQAKTEAQLEKLNEELARLRTSKHEPRDEP